MKALMYLGPKNMKIAELPEISPKAGEVKIAVKYVGICGSDLHGYVGKNGRRVAPMIMGHEFSGVIEEIGDGVAGLKIGDKVTVCPLIECGECDYCSSGRGNICPRQRLLGTLDDNGAMVEKLCIDADQILKLPEKMDLETGALIEPFAVAYSAVKKALPIRNKTVLITGAGTIGLFILIAAKYFGAKDLIAVDLSKERLQKAEELGATCMINPSLEAANETLKAMGLEKKIDVAFDAVGAGATVQTCLDSLKNGGISVWVGMMPAQAITNISQIVSRELKISGSYIYTKKDFVDAMGYLGSGEIDASPMISKRVGLYEAEAAFREQLAGVQSTVKVLIQI